MLHKETYFSVYSLKSLCVKALKLNSWEKFKVLTELFHYLLSSTILQGRDFKLTLPISLCINKENYRTPFIVDTSLQPCSVLIRLLWKGP